MASIRDLFKLLVPGYGRGIEYETATTGASLTSETESDDLNRLPELALDPYIFAGKRYRDISRLWIAAKGIGDPDAGEAYSPGQIIYPPHRTAGDPAVLEFVQWNFDERMNSKGMRSVISQIQDAYLTYGRAVCEVLWARETQGPYTGKIVFSDILSHDPERFVINPKGYDPGIYLKQSAFSTTVSAENRLPDKKFMVFTNHLLFENPNGVSEIALLDQFQKYLTETFGFYAKGLERSGVGALIGKYGRELLGKGGKEKREEFIEELQKLKSNTITIMYKDNEVMELSTDINSDAFADFMKTIISAIGLVLTGSPTTLIESRFGTYGQAEATTTREKSGLEQTDASILCDGFNYQLIPWLVDFNYPNQISYPWMQIIEPDLIQPTVSEGQQDLVLDEEEERDGVMGQAQQEQAFRDFLKEFAEDEEGQKAESETEKKTESFRFPDDTEPPPIFAEVTNDAKRALQDMPIYTKAQFDELPENQKQDAFTIASLKGHDMQLDEIRQLKEALIESLDEPNEAAAWQAYFRQAQSILQPMAVAPDDLIASFRYARQSAYMRGIKQYVNRVGDTLHGIQFATQEDAAVRSSHRLLDGIVRPVDDPLWRDVEPPLSFNCRCYWLPVSQADYEADPEQYSYTPDEDIPDLSRIDLFDNTKEN